MLKKILVICFVLSVSISCLYAQNKTIYGRVIDDNLETLPYVSIIINDTVKVGKTDINGFFHVEIPVSAQKILLSTVGVELASIDLKDKCDNVEIIMMVRCTCDFITFKNTDKLRMIRFNKIPELHKKAFEKGLFTTDKVCYSQEFIPNYRKKQK